MATKRQIEMNFQQAKKQAEALEQLASRLDRLAGRDFAGTMQDVSNHWKGQNATQYLNKASILQSKMQTSAKSLNSIAASIRTAAKRMHDAELRAWQIAQQRTYNGGGGGSW